MFIIKALCWSYFPALCNWNLLTDAVWLEHNKVIVAWSRSVGCVYFIDDKNDGKGSLSVGDKNKGKGNAAEIGVWNLFIYWGRFIYIYNILLARRYDIKKYPKKRTASGKWKNFYDPVLVNNYACDFRYFNLDYKSISDFLIKWKENKENPQIKFIP